MKELSVTFTALLLTIYTFGQKPLKTLIKENEQSIFLVQCFNEKNQMIGTGSGFFIEVSGIALTNVHVVKNAYRAKIKTVDGKFYEVEKIIDYNPTFDIAKIQIKHAAGTSFKAVKVAKKISEKGEEIFAIGNPDGLENSVSTGIISSIRSIPNYGLCYQITAPISPGSSGGALFNFNGEVIGITTFGQTDQSRLNQNLNFAVNIDNAKYLKRQQNLRLDKAYNDIVYEDFAATYMQANLSGDNDRAINICNQQLQKKPNDWLAYYFRANTYLGLERYAEAEPDILKSIEYNSTTTLKDVSYMGLGKIYRIFKLYEKSKQAYFKALEINPQSADCFCAMVVLATDWLGAENELVVYSYQKALEIDPLSCPGGYKKIGEKLLKDKEYEKAIEIFTVAIKLEEKEIYSLNEYYNRGTCYFILKQYDKAISDFKQCIRLSPEDYQSFIAIGRAYINTGRKQEGCYYFSKVAEINEASIRSNDVKIQVQSYQNENCR